MAYTASTVKVCRRPRQPPTLQLQTRAHPLRIPHYRGNRLSHCIRRWSSQDPLLTLADLSGGCGGQAATDGRRTFILLRRPPSWRKETDRR